MALLDTVYATDEDLFVRAGYDLALITPRHQAVAQAADGVLDGGDFVLTSASSDFTTAGVRAGMILQVTDPRSSLPSGIADALAIESVGVTTLTLRRVGLAAGEGKPPYAEDTAGIGFRIQTLRPQIEECSYDLNERLGLNARRFTAANLDDVRQIRRACVAMVLKDAYTAASRMAGQAADDFAAKGKMFADELSDRMARLNVRWLQPQGEVSVNIGSTRLSR